MVDGAAAREIGVEAYVFLYPLVLMDVTRRQMTNVEPGQQFGRGPVGAFTHARQYPAADFKDVVRPNFDTLYSPAWIDVRAEPVVVSAPGTQGRYYMLPMLDMWTDVFANPGTRTSGNDAHDFAVVPVGWTGPLPAGVERIETPTPVVWIIGRTKTDGPADYEAVHQVQDGFRITPLSSWGQQPPPVQVLVDPSVDMITAPLDQVNALSGLEFFRYGAELMKVHPPHVTDWSTIARLRRIGIEAGQSFDADALDPGIRQALDLAPGNAQKVLHARLPGLARIANGWQLNLDTMGVYGDFYVKRAVVAMVGLGANPAEDAVYPILLADADGKPLDGGSSYLLHFDAGQLPPVDAFWSVTMYDGQGFQAANPVNRFAIGDRDDLRFNPDGSLDLYIQHDSPGDGREANWLPAPDGPLGVTMRLYSPQPAVLDGSWTPPPVHRTSQPDTTA
jgi:hypothetical protein